MEAKDISVPEKIWNPQFISLFIANALLYFGQEMVQPTITKYAADMGAGASLLGFVAGVFSISSILLKFAAAPITDIFQRKNVLATAIIIMAISFFGYSISTSISMIIAFRLVQGACQAFTTTCCLALATDSLPPDKIGSGISIFSLSQAISQAIGPGMGLAIGKRFGFNLAYVTAGSIMLAAFILAIRIKIRQPNEKRTFKFVFSSFISIPALFPAFLMFMLICCFCLINSFLVIFSGDRGVENIGWFFTLYALTLFLSRPLFGKLQDKYGFFKVIIPAMLLFVISLLIISFSHSLIMFLIAAVLFGFGYGSAQPMINALCMKSVPPEKRGVASSTRFMGSDLGNIVGPIIAGFLITVVGYELMWRYMTVSIFIAIITVLIFRKKINKIEALSKPKN